MSAIKTIPLHVEVKGQGSPILCLHGHPGSGRSMSVFTDFLSQHYQTLAPDLRGYGKSRFSGRFEMRDHLADLEALLDRFEIERCLLLGWSLGGILALELALSDPRRYSGAILVASAARPRGSHPPVGWQDLLNTGIAGILNCCHPGWQWNIETFAKRSLFRYLLQQHTATSYRYLAKEGTVAYLQTSQAAQQALSAALKTKYNRLDALKRLQMPCLVLAGAADCHITAESSHETVCHLPNAQWRCYPNTAHLFPWEIPLQVQAEIKDWLQTYPEVVKNGKGKG